MKKVFRFILFSNRNRRCKAIHLILWFLQQIRDVEKDEAYRFSDMLDGFESINNNDSLFEYTRLEEEYTTCEFAFDVLNSAIVDLEFAY